MTVKGIKKVQGFWENVAANQGVTLDQWIAGIEIMVVPNYYGINTQYNIEPQSRDMWYIYRNDNGNFIGRIDKPFNDGGYIMYQTGEEYATIREAVARYARVFDH
jgi:hypothetical protein